MHSELESELIDTPTMCCRCVSALKSVTSFPIAVSSLSFSSSTCNLLFIPLPVLGCCAESSYVLKLLFVASWVVIATAVAVAIAGVVPNV